MIWLPLEKNRSMIRCHRGHVKHLNLHLGSACSNQGLQEPLRNTSNLPCARDTQHTVKALLCAIHGKGLTANSSRQRTRHTATGRFPVVSPVVPCPAIGTFCHSLLVRLTASLIAKVIHATYIFHILEPGNLSIALFLYPMMFRSM